MSELLARATLDFDPATGEIAHDLASPYLAHRATGLLHLPRFLTKIRRHLRGDLPKSYQRNFCKGFDRFLCLHLGVEPQSVIDAVRDAKDAADLDARLLAIFPADVRAAEGNRELEHHGMREKAREAPPQAKDKMGIGGRTDLCSFADMIEYDEGRLA